MAKIQKNSKEKQKKLIRRGEIYLTSFDPSVGREIRKTRPALIIQNDIGNAYSSLTIVAAITSKISPVPYPVEVITSPTKQNGLRTNSSIRLDQIRAIDKLRLIKRLGTIDPLTMQKVNEAIKISLGLVEF